MAVETPRLGQGSPPQLTLLFRLLRMLNISTAPAGRSAIAPASPRIGEGDRLRKREFEIDIDIQGVA